MPPRQSADISVRRGLRRRVVGVKPREQRNEKRQKAEANEADKAGDRKMNRYHVRHRGRWFFNDTAHPADWHLQALVQALISVPAPQPESRPNF